MRLFEIKLDETVPVPEGEVNVGNQINVFREDGEFYGQVRTDLDASYRDVNQNYFDQTTLPIDFQETSPEEYFNNFQFPNPDSTEDSGDLDIRYLPGRDNGYQKNFDSLSAYRVDYVPFLDDLFGIQDQRIFAERIFGQVQEALEGENVTEEEFQGWIQEIEPERYKILLEDFENLAQSEEFFHRDVVNEKQHEKRAFVRYIAREVIHQQRENYDQAGPNQTPADDVFAELPGYEQIAEQIPLLAEETHFETTFKDPFGRSLLEYIEQTKGQEESQVFREFRETDEEESGSRNLEDNSNILQESGISSVEGILTAKPEEIVNFLDEERL